MVKQKSQWLFRNRPAIYRMDIPKRGVLEGQIRYNNIGGIYQLNKMRPSIVQLAVVEPVPPNVSLTINRTISSCQENQIYLLAN